MVELVRGDVYPVLPLRDIVVFPHMIVPLFVGREKSVRALEDEELVERCARALLQRAEQVGALGLLDVVVLPAVRDEHGDAELRRVLEVVALLPETVVVRRARVAALGVLELLAARAGLGLVAIGTGRTLKAAVELLPRMECPQHKVVSLTGNIAPDGSAAYYNVIFNLADSVKARSFPMPLPVIASSPRERIST